MAILNWPAYRWASPATVRWAIQVQRAAWSAAYTGQAQRISHLADRIRVSMTMPVARDEAAAQREAFLLRLNRSGDWVRLWHFARPIPLGTLRGSPTASAATRGATSLTLQTTAGATLVGGDLLGVAGQIIQVAYPGATANGSGAIVVPLVSPLRVAVSNAAAVTWDKPTGTFQLLGADTGLDYIAPRRQLGLELQFLEVFA
jgi:hypothetical protein